MVAERSLTLAILVRSGTLEPKPEPRLGDMCSERISARGTSATTPVMSQGGSITQSSPRRKLKRSVMSTFRHRHEGRRHRDDGVQLQVRLLRPGEPLTVGSTKDQDRALEKMLEHTCRIQE